MLRLNVCQFTVKSDSVVASSSAGTILECLRVFFILGVFWEEGSFFILLFVFIFCGFPFARESNRSKVSLDHKKEEPLSLFNPLCEYILENTAFKFPKGIISKRQRQRGL